MFKTEIVITLEYLNHGGHVSYNAYLSIAHEAVIRWLKLYDMTEVNLGEGVGYVITRAVMNYKSESFHGDVLIVEVSCANQKAKRFDFLYKMINKETGRIVAFGETEQVFFDFTSRKLGKPSKIFIEKFCA